MNRDKIIRRIGDSVGIIFNKEERIIANISVNDSVNIILKKIKEDPKNDL